MSDQPAESKLDIFQLLAKLDVKDRNFYDSLSDAQRKQFVPVVVMQWLANTSNNEIQTVVVNELVNKYVFSLYKHPKLLFFLMTQCTTGKKQRYSWSGVKKKVVKFPQSIQVVATAFGFSAREADKYFNLIDNDQILSLAMMLGYQPDQIKLLNKELKTR